MRSISMTSADVDVAVVGGGSAALVAA